MAKLTKEYFTNNQVLILGYPLKDDADMKMIMSGFQKNQITVYPFNEHATEPTPIKIYKDFSELSKVPQCAYIYLAKEDITPWIDILKENGVKRVLFHAQKYVTQSDLDACKKAGFEVAIACPMMLLGKGIHSFHKFLAKV